MIRVRAGAPDDAPAIAAIEAVAATRPWPVSALVDHLNDPHRGTLVVPGGEALAGHVLLSIAADEGEILSLAVHPGSRRRGVARALLVAVDAWWAQRGVRTGWLEVRDDNGAAVALYQSTGWTPAGRRKSYYGVGVDALVMRREVPAC